jgi:hypothetical protein
MLIKTRKSSDVQSSEITLKSVFLERRKFMKTAAVAGASICRKARSQAGQATRSDQGAL